ncbi:MAG: hypothetical protein Q9218_004425 [Villophora microphyllina]
MANRPHPLLPTPPSCHRNVNDGQMYTAVKSSAAAGSVMIDTTSKYRMGAPAPLLALPLKCHEPWKESPAYKAFEKIRANIGILGWSLNLYRRSVPGAAPTDDDYTILLSCRSWEKRPDNQDGWLPAMEDILEVLQQNSVSRLFRVELIDGRARTSFFRQTPYVRRTELLEVKVLDVLGHGPQWDTLTYYNCGWTEWESLPTITVGMTQAADVKWQQSIYQEIRTILGSFPGTEVAFIRSTLLAKHHTLPQWLHACTGPVPMGSSIGIGTTSGTLGGYVKVSYGGKEYTMGLTTHRLITNAAMTAEEEINGYAPDLTRSVPKIFSPSERDMEATAAQFEEPRGLKADVGEDAILRRRGRFEHWAKWQAKDPKGTDGMLTGPQFGSVFASSGSQRTYATDYVSDWAFILVDPARVGTNDIESFRTLDPYVGSGGLEDIAYAEASGLIDGTCMLAKGRYGDNMSSVNGSHVHINMHNGSLPILKAIAVVDQVTRQRFSADNAPGDVGCWSTDTSGKWNSMTFAVEEETKSRYIIPAYHLVDDIQQKTGARIIAPEMW